MAENKTEKKPAKKEAADAGETVETTVGQRVPKVSRWTLATCKKASKRFETREAWQKGHPSSFKAAVAKGWDKECCAHMTQTAPKAAKTKTATPKKTPAKKPVRAA